ncbi:hypothetical protein B0H17DRAFT_1324896 [Mycena rosella]|uniref:DUF6534 domain-containing protein n=1 Tax=Mycena rosella TaxID=1033263 RepID=A0AAD7MBB7_MYCRO|nr:hypothetical protein B0H17DRAFT_1324896 [Mycena rosella]
MSAPLLPDRITPLTQAQFSETYGGSLICCMVSLPIYGISLLQVHMYYMNYPLDNKWIKIMVALLVIFESAHTWMTCHTVYHYSILSYSNPLSLIDGEWSVYTANALGIPIVLLIQIYFSRMVYLLAHKKWKLLVIIVFGLLIVAQIGFGIYTCVERFKIWELPKLKALVYPALVPLYGIRVVSDAITAGALCLVLYDATIHTLFHGSSKLFKTLIIYAMNRFILTTVVVIVQTSVLLAKPASIWAMVLEFITVHLYVNSLLATLNARKSLREIGPSLVQDDLEKSMPKFKAPSRYSSTQNGSRLESNGQPPVNLYLGKQGNRGGVKIDQDTFTMSDLEEGSLKNDTSMSALT